MNRPFPERFRTEPGLTKRRLPWGMPSGMVAILALLLLAPLLIWGKSAWWVVPLLLPVVVGLAIVVKDDPDFLRTAQGELQLEDRYD
jgi:Type IV secretory pathway, VirB3-like protein